MKINQFWLNLLVSDLEKSKMFFKSIGFTPNRIHSAATHLGSFLIVKIIMLQSYLLKLYSTGFAQN